MIEQEQLGDFLFAAVALLALSLFPLIQKRKLDDWKPLAMAGLLLVVVMHYFAAGYSDHTATGAQLRLVIVLAMSFIGMWGATVAIWELVKTVGNNSFKPVVPLARTLVFVLGWLLKAIAYLLAIAQVWILAANASRRYLEGMGLTGGFTDAVAATGGGVGKTLSTVLLVVGWPSLAVVVFLLIAGFFRKRYLARKAKKKAKRDAKTAKKTTT